MMDSLKTRVIRRFKAAASNVVPMNQKRPKSPAVLIHGRKYSLSNYWPMMSDVEEMAPEGGGGARLINVGGGRFRYLWVYDTDRKIVAMWRYSDGDEKVHERDSTAKHHIYALEKKGQLNRVTHDEFVAVEREMSRRQDDTIRALKKTIEENATEWDHRVKDILKKWFDDRVRPEMDRKIAEFEKGVLPFGFKSVVDDPRTRERQARGFIMSQVLTVFSEARAYQHVTDEVGFDAYEPPDGDQQAVQWEYHNQVQELGEEYLRGY